MLSQTSENVIGNTSFKQKVLLVQVNEENIRLSLDNNDESQTLQT